MRNPERLDGFYDEMRKIHKEQFPDWRFGQLMMNFFNWVVMKKKCDTFFPEEDKMLQYLKEFAEIEEE